MDPVKNVISLGHKMHLLYCDETNLDPKNHKFFVYGGIVIPCDNAKALHDEIETIRKNSSIPNDFSLKFNPKPPNLPHDEFNKVKQAVIEAAIQNNCFFLSSIIMHQIATSSDDARRNEINRVLFHFNSLLNRIGSYGLCLIDRFSDAQIDSHLREKFAVGVRGLPYAGDMRLERIIGFHYSAIGQSHFSTIIDIVLGSFRYSVNAHCSQDPAKLRSADVLLRIIEPLFFRDDHTGKVIDLSLNFSPKIIRSDIYRQEYQSVKNFLTEKGIEPSQEITEFRTY
jgi:hypothetical protein